MKSILLLVVFFILTISLRAQSFLENKPWQEVKKEAVEQKKLIFMDCYTVWCGPCKGLSEKVFPQAKVQNFLKEHFVACKYDMEKGDGAMLYEKYKAYIPGFPTMLVINPADETVVHKVVGFTEADALIQALQDELDGKTLAAFQKRYEAGNRSLTFMQEYCQALDVAYEEETKERVVRDFVESMPLDSLLNRSVFELYEPYLDDVYSPRFEFVVEHVNDYARKFKMNRYNIESGIRRTMSSAVGDLIDATLTTTDKDSLDMLREKEEVLKKLLMGNVKGFREEYAKLVINDVRQSGDMVALDAILEADKLLRATDGEIIFRPHMYAYIVEYADVEENRSFVEKYLGMIQQRQDEDNERSGGKVSIFSANDYDVLAIGYHRLGNQEKSETCAKEFERRFKAKMDEMATVFKDEKSKKEMADNYERTMKELYAKIGMNR